MERQTFSKQLKEGLPWPDADDVTAFAFYQHNQPFSVRKQTRRGMPRKPRCGCPSIRYPDGLWLDKTEARNRAALQLDGGWDSLLDYVNLRLYFRLHKPIPAWWYPHFRMMLRDLKGGTQ